MFERVYKDSVFGAAFLVLVAVSFVGEFEAFSLAVGAALSIANLVLLFVLVQKLVMGSSRIFPVLLWMAKLVIVVLFLILVLTYLKLGVVYVLVGLTLPFIALIYEALRAAWRSDKNG